MNLIRVKKSFTLIELIIVIILISTTYFLVFSNTNFHIKTDDKKLNLYELKDFLLKNFEFERNLTFLCIEDNFSCFVKVDGVIEKDFKVLNFFEIKPEIYEYNTQERQVEFEDLRVENFDYKVIFELKINSDYKTNEFILDTLQNEVYVFNSIFTQPQIFKSLNDSFDSFELNQKEVKDAF